jgi:putative transposase
MELVLRRCSERCNAALEERRDAWQKRGVPVNEGTQSAQLLAVKEVRPECRDVQSLVLQDVLTRLTSAFQAFFARVSTGERPGHARHHGTNRDTSFTAMLFGTGATPDNGYLVLSASGRMAVRWSQPFVGTLEAVTVSRDADSSCVGFSCADMRGKPLPVTGQETGRDLGLEAFVTHVTAERTVHSGGIARPNDAGQLRRAG